MATLSIPFNKPSFAGRELEYIAESMRLGHVSGDGPFTLKCHQLLTDLLAVKKTLLTTSCTHALEMAAMLLNIKEGDEVILPAFTFVSTANAFVCRGAKPVFADILPDTLNIDPASVRKLVTSKTRAVVPVHYGGVACDMQPLLDICREFQLELVEDNAHGLFGKYRGQNLGTFGCMSAQSFHETKNFHCGEGGALLLNTVDLIERAEIIREKGTNRSRFFRGQIDKYTWVDLGSSYLPSDMLAAFLFAQLEERDTIQAHRQRIWHEYKEALSEWSFENKIALQFVPEDREHSFHLFCLIMPDQESRQDFIRQMKEAGILTVHHYQPLNTSEMGRKFGYTEGDCPVTEYVSDRLVRLPLYNSLSPKEQSQIVRAAKAFRPARVAAR